MALNSPALRLCRGWLAFKNAAVLQHDAIIAASFKGKYIRVSYSYDGHEVNNFCTSGYLSHVINSLRWCVANCSTRNIRNDMLEAIAWLEFLRLQVERHVDYHNNRIDYVRGVYALSLINDIPLDCRREIYQFMG